MIKPSWTGHDFELIELPMQLSDEDVERIAWEREVVYDRMLDAAGME